MLFIRQTNITHVTDEDTIHIHTQRQLTATSNFYALKLAYFLFRSVRFAGFLFLHFKRSLELIGIEYRLVGALLYFLAVDVLRNDAFHNISPIDCLPVHSLFII